jgi:hypothetical protein
VRDCWICPFCPPLKTFRRCVYCLDDDGVQRRTCGKRRCELASAKFGSVPALLEHVEEVHGLTWPWQ